MQSALTADPRQTCAAEGRAKIAQEPGVDPADADAHRLTDTVRAIEIGGPDGRSQPIARVIRKRNHFTFGVERCDMTDGAENLFFHAPGGFGQSGNDRRLDPKSLISCVTKMWNAATD